MISAFKKIKTVKIGPHNIPVHFSKEKIRDYSYENGMDVAGYTSLHGPHEIVVMEDSHPAPTAEVLLHEISHAILQVYQGSTHKEAYSNEDVAAIFGLGILDLINNNFPVLLVIKEAVSGKAPSKSVA